MCVCVGSHAWAYMHVCGDINTLHTCMCLYMYVCIHVMYH